MRWKKRQVLNQARLCAEKLKEAMNQKIPGQTSNNDAFAQVFGPEHPGRVRCVGRGPTPSKYFSSLDSTSYNEEIVGIKSDLKNVLDKVDLVASALQAFIGSTCNQFQVSEADGNMMVNILQQAISRYQITRIKNKTKLLRPIIAPKILQQQSHSW